LDPPPGVAGDNATGISLNIDPDRQLSLMRQVLPRLGRVGLLYDPNKSSAFVERAKAAASRNGMELLVGSVATPRDVVSAINGLAGKVNALWMFPDTTVVSPVTIDLLLLAAIEQRIPVFTFSGKYVEKGALLSLEIDEFAVGRQAGEMGNRILAGAGVRSVERVDARDGVVTFNAVVANRLGIRVDGDVLRHARVVPQRK
jgi:putative ABC transport system substrate-binding protein